MTKTKHSLLMSAVALLLCASMLIGTTFAWFTDTVVSSGNVIKSGTLEVSLEWLEGQQDPSDKDSTAWNNVESDGAEPIFNYTLWEPGYTAVRHIKIENEGTLALKYQLNIIPLKADGTKAALSDFSKVVDGKTVNLADAIDVYYIDPADKPINDRAELPSDKYLGTLTEVLANLPATAQGTLEAEKFHTVTLGLKMQETAGNEYQDMEIGASFDIQLLATQLDSEFDSIDNKYDEGLIPGDIVKKTLDDGSVIAYTNGQAYLYDVSAVTTTDYTVPEGVTSLANYVLGTNNNIDTVVLSSTVDNLGRAFDETNVKTVVLNEGLEQIDSRAFRSTASLEEVVIPSTVKTIEDNAFQKSGIKTIVIPATVETIGETAFGASKIETVIIEGNTSIQGFAFRGCPNLRTVYLLGDDVTFIASTLNGRNSMWFCNGESNNPNTSNITFYVKNEEVASRVRTAMGAEADNTTIIVVDKNIVEYDPAVNGGVYDTLTSMVPGQTLVLPAGTYETSGTFSIPHGVTVKGADGEEVIFKQTSSAQDNIFNCLGDAVIENITFMSNRKGYAVNGAAKDHNIGADITIVNCSFIGIASEKNWGVYKNLYGNLTIKDSTFDNYNNAICGVNNGGDSTTVITGCTFTNINGEAIGYVASSMPTDFEETVIANNTGLTAGNVIGY